MSDIRMSRSLLNAHLLLSAAAAEISSSQPAEAEPEKQGSISIPISDLPASVQRLLRSSGTYRIGPNRAPLDAVLPFTGKFAEAMEKANQLQAATGVHHHVEDTRTTKVLYDTARCLPKTQAAKLMAVPIQ